MGSAAALAAAGLSGWTLVAGATVREGDPEPKRLAWTATGSGSIGMAADLELRFVEEGGPESGHVRVMLTPETRPLTLLEARAAAQQAFLEALDEPGLGSHLQRIVVQVRLMPESLAADGAADPVFQFLRRGDRTWSLRSGE